MSDLKQSALALANKNPRIAHLILDRVVEAAGVRDFLPLLHSIFPKASSGQDAFRILKTEVLPYLASEYLWDGDLDIKVTATTEYVAFDDGGGYSRDPRSYSGTEVQVEVPSKVMASFDAKLTWKDINRLIMMEGGDLQALALACEDRKFAGWMAGEIEQAIHSYLKGPVRDHFGVTLDDELDGKAHAYGAEVSIQPGFYEPKIAPKRVEVRVSGRGIHMKVDVDIDLDYNDDNIEVSQGSY